MLWGICTKEICQISPNLVRGNHMQVRGPQKLYCKHLVGDDRKSRAKAGRRLQAKLSCTNPARKSVKYHHICARTKSKLRSGATRMLSRGQRKFGPITSSVRGDSRKREPASPGCPNALVSVLRKNKAQNCGPEHSCVESYRSKNSRQAPFRRKLDVPK